MDGFGILIIIVLGVLCLGIVFWLLKFLCAGAIILFDWASEQAFVGIAAYFACWFFLFPIMIVGSIIVGAFVWWDNR